MNKLNLTHSNRWIGYSTALIGSLLLASEALAAGPKPPSEGGTQTVQTVPPKYGTVSSRFLLIVETSRAMGHRSDATMKTAGSLLYSGFNHQIKQGDTVGVWTFNDQLYTGRMPLQRWSTPLLHGIVDDTLKFLKAQKYEKQPTFSSVRPALDKVIKESEFITVILISSGQAAVSGTPFDDKINELYNNWKGDQEKERMPFLTVLRAKRGTIISYVAVPVPWQAEIPPWPVETNAAPTVVASLPPNAQTSAVPALIFTGKKPQPAESIKPSEVAPARQSAPAATASPAPTPSVDVPVESRTSEPSQVVPEKQPIAPAPQTTVIEQRAQPSETPQLPAEPAPTAPSNPVASDVAPKSETVSPVLADVTNTSNPALAETVQESTPVPRDISTAVAIPRNGLFSGNMIWLVGVAVFGIVCALLFVVTRRAPPEHISMITRSLERESK
jgi:hypothetical protein